MKCAYCGKNNKPGAVVCKRCGVALPVPPPSNPGSSNSSVEDAQVVETGKVIDSRKTGGVASGKLKMSRKTAAIGIAAIIGVIAAAVLVIVLIANSGSLVLHKTSSYFVNGSAVYYKGESIVPDSTGNAAAVSDLGGSRAAILSADGNLYACAKGQSTLAAKKVEKFCLSVNGNYLAYTDSDGLLWRYDCKDPSNAPVCIFNNAVKDGFAVSPDGGTVLFTRESDSVLCTFVNGKIKTYEGCTGHLPVAVSNGAKHIYSYSPDDNSVYYTNSRGKTSFLRSNLASEIFLNSKHDEIVFASNSGNMKLQTLISASGGEPVELCNSADVVQPVLPVSGCSMEGVVPNFTVVTCPFKTFSEKLFAGSGLVKYSKKTGVTVLLPDTILSARATDNYQTVFCTSSSGLSRIDLKAADSPVRITESCSSFSVSTNGKVIWYKDLGNILHYVKGSSDTEIAIGVEDFASTASGKVCAFMVSGSLYINKSGSASKSYPVETGEFMKVIAADAANVYYLDGSNVWQKIGKTGKAVNLAK